MKAERVAGGRFSSPRLDHFHRGDWPAKWVRLECTERSFVAAYRVKFVVSSVQTVRLHVSADQRYELFLDGQHIGRGPERGDPYNWFYETYDLSVDVGEHVLVAKVWTLDPQRDAPAPQMTSRHGLIVAAEEPLANILSTGIAAWEGKVLQGYFFIPGSAHIGQFMGSTSGIDGRSYCWGCESGDEEGWRPVNVGHVGKEMLNAWGELRYHILRPAMLPAMMDQPMKLGRVRHVETLADDNTEAVEVRAANHLSAEAGGWQTMFAGDGNVIVKPNRRIRVIVDLEEYYCAYVDVTLSGGRDARVRVNWAEALYTTDANGKLVKSDRSQIEGLRFLGRWNEYIADGASHRTYSPLWWNCGRYVELFVEPKDQPLTIDAITFRETRYPIEMESQLHLDNSPFMSAVPIMWRTMQMCMHETYFDCPYWEQLMYTGDTRLEVLTTYVTSSDDRLPRKAIAMFDCSRGSNGLTASRYPSLTPQVIPQFSLYWISMLHDFAMWRGDRHFLESMIPGMRQTIERFIASVDGEGMLDLPPGWNFIDWVPEWKQHGSPQDASGRSSINQWQMIMTLGQVAELARYMEAEDLAERVLPLRDRMVDAAIRTFWVEDRGLFADTPGRNSFSEHGQCFAVISGRLDDSKLARIAHGLLNDPDLARATIYFRFYLFEAFRMLGRIDAIEQRLGLWYGLKDQGFKTAPEAPEPSRSDCHAWSAHPIYHAYASFLGIRPAEFGFARVRIAPELGSMRHAKADMVHPKGRIVVEFERFEERLKAEISLPAGLSGEIVYRGRVRELSAGRNSLEM